MITPIENLLQNGADMLSTDDPELHSLLARETLRQSDTLALIAASSIADPSVLVCQATATSNITTEGFPGARFHGGCELVDKIEGLAIDRAKEAFGADYANVQPHSGTTANQIVLFSILKPGDTLLGMELDSGGHLTHGSRASAVGQLFNAVGYGLNKEGFIDYDQVAELAKIHRPKLIICGASSYPRQIHFDRFRAIADEVGAYLMADISHIAGLVVGGQHQSPIHHAHFTTTSTYKQLYGPRGGLILMGRDHNRLGPKRKGTLSGLIQRGVFPFFQGTPNLSTIAAKARALAIVAQPEFRERTQRIVDNAREFALCLAARGYRVLTGGTDNHMVLIDVLSRGITGYVAEKALEECHIIVNKNRIPGDSKSARVTSGIRMGTNCVAYQGFGTKEMRECAALVDKVLSSVEVSGDRSCTLDREVRRSVLKRVRTLCARYPIPDYPQTVEVSQTESPLTLFQVAT